MADLPFPLRLFVVTMENDLGPVTLNEMVHEWSAHDLNHTMQAEEALIQPFIRGCGPWQCDFSAHVAGNA